MKNKKILIGILTGLFFIIIIWLLSKSTTDKKSSKNTSPLIENTTPQSSSSADTFVLKNDVSSLTWENYDNNFKDTTVTEYNIEKAKLEDLSANIAKTLGFSESEKTISPLKNVFWKKATKNILYLKDDNIIKVEFILPTTTKTGFLEKEINSTINSFVSKILPKNDLQISSIEYFLEDKNIPILGTQQNSKLAKVNLSQTINGIKILPENISSEFVVSIIIDSSLNIRSVKIRDLVINYIATNKKQEILSSQIKQIIPNEIHRLTPFSIKTENLIKENLDNKFSINSVEVAYLINKDKLRPVFYLSGKILNKNQEIGEASFVSPIPIPAL